MELIFEITDQSGRSHQYRRLSGERLTVGRAWDNDLILSDPAVNPHHAIIELDENRQLMITDLDTLNGTQAGEDRQHQCCSVCAGAQHKCAVDSVWRGCIFHECLEGMEWGWVARYGRKRGSIRRGC